VFSGCGLGHEQSIPGRDDGIFADAQGELARVNQAEHQPGALAAHDTKRLSDRSGLRVDLR
jgi:hypothetical protein